MSDTSTNPADLSWWRRKGRGRLLVWLLILIILPVVAYSAGRRAQTPAESIANAAPPERRPVVAEVEYGTLVSEEVFRGLVVSEVTEITITVAEAGAVTADPPASGTTLAEGSVILEIDDRPVIVLEGVLPLLGDIEPGARGSIVRQLQESLIRLELLSGDANGVFDWRTRDAVVRLYRSLEYAAPTNATNLILPASEFIFLPQAEVQILENRVFLGSVVEGETEVASVYRGRSMVNIDVRESDLPYLSVGTEVVLRGDRGEMWGSAIVVSNEPAEGEQTDRWLVVADPIEDLDVAMIGTSIQVVVGGGEAEGLIVPATAVRADPTGSLFVLVVDDNWTVSRVDVTAGLAVGGFVIIEGDVEEGDLVVVGE